MKIPNETDDGRALKLKYVHRLTRTSLRRHRRWMGKKQKHRVLILPPVINSNPNTIPLDRTTFSVVVYAGPSPRQDRYVTLS